MTNRIAVSATPDPASIAPLRLPSGMVTFAFTDIEGSTKRWDRDSTAMQEAVRRHDTLMRAVITEHGSAPSAASALPNAPSKAARTSSSSLANTPSSSAHRAVLSCYLVAVDDVLEAQAVAHEAIVELATREPDAAYVAIAIENLALGLALRGDLSRAAMLEGYVEPALLRHGFGREFNEATTHDRLTALLRERLAADELTRLLADGAALAPETAVALALGRP